MRIMYKLVFSSIELLSWEVTDIQSLEQNLKRSWKDMKKKKKTLVQDRFYWPVLHTSSHSKNMLRSQIVTSSGESFVSQESTRQVNRNILWSDWHSDPCLNFIVRASVEAELSFSDSGDTDNITSALIFVKFSSSQVEVYYNRSLTVPYLYVGSAPILSPECCQMHG